MSNIALSFAIHYSSFMIFLVFLTWDLSYMDLPAHRTYAGRSKFLTFISFVINLVYNNFAAIIDFQMWMRGKDSPLWRKVRDFVFTTLAFPLVTFVCIMFWGICLIDSNALRTAEEAKLIPWWFDHGYHTLPIIFVFLQSYFIEHTYPQNKMAFVSTLMFDFFYICWLFWIAHKANFWVYPMMSRMTLPGVFLFLAASVMISFGFYFVGKIFTDIVWNRNKEKVV